MLSSRSFVKKSSVHRLICFSRMVLRICSATGVPPGSRVSRFEESAKTPGHKPARDFADQGGFSRPFRPLKRDEKTFVFQHVILFGYAEPHRLVKQRSGSILLRRLWMERVLTRRASPRRILRGLVRLSASHWMGTVHLNRPASDVPVVVPAVLAGSEGADWLLVRDCRTGHIAVQGWAEPHFVEDFDPAEDSSDPDSDSLLSRLSFPRLWGLGWPGDRRDHSRRCSLRRRRGTLGTGV